MYFILFYLNEIKNMSEKFAIIVVCNGVYVHLKLSQNVLFLYGINTSTKQKVSLVRPKYSHFRNTNHIVVNK